MDKAQQTFIVLPSLTVVALVLNLTVTSFNSLSVFSALKTPGTYRLAITVTNTLGFDCKQPLLSPVFYTVLHA